MLNNTPNQLSKFRTRNWIEINDQSRGVCNVNSRFKTTMWKSSWCDYSDAYILLEGRITVTGAGANVAETQADEKYKGVIFNNCAPFINFKDKINNIEIDNAKDIDIVMPMYNSIEPSDSYSKTSGSLWQYYKDEPTDILTDSESFKSKIITGKTPGNINTKHVEIIVPLKCLSNFSKILSIPLINCEVNTILTWSSTWVIANYTGAGTFPITDAKLYVPVATLSTQDHAKFLKQLKYGFKRTINWNKCQSDPKTDAQNQYINYLADPSFHEVNRLFVLPFENKNGRTSHSEYYLPKVKIKKLYC